jgi:hypothetical protein
MNSFARDAIMAAANHIERHPEQYSFMKGTTPYPGDRACVLGWIGHFMNLGCEIPVEQVARSFHVTHDMEPDIDFYHTLDKIDPTMSEKCPGWRAWQADGKAAARVMRQYAGAL